MAEKKRKPGRPRKEESEKRKPGRPRKEESAKRKPGRPRKEEPAKRKPGRPPKASTTDLSQLYSAEGEVTANWFAGREGSVSEATSLGEGRILLAGTWGFIHQVVKPTLRITSLVYATGLAISVEEAIKGLQKGEPEETPSGDDDDGEDGEDDDEGEEEGGDDEGEEEGGDDDDGEEEGGDDDGDDEGGDDEGEDDGDDEDGDDEDGDDDDDWGDDDAA